MKTNDIDVFQNGILKSDSGSNDDTHSMLPHVDGYNLKTNSDGDSNDATMLEKEYIVKTTDYTGSNGDSPTKLDHVKEEKEAKSVDKGAPIDDFEKDTDQKDEDPNRNTDDDIVEELMLDDDDNIEYDDEEESTGEDVDEFDSPLGLEYLGAGYDLIKGNPLGDTITLLDPGFRANIIQMRWRKDVENISNSLQYIQPKGVWIRSYISCHKGDSVSEVGSAESIKKTLAVDAVVSAELPGDAAKFAASASYNNIRKAGQQKDKNVYISKSYCFNYVAGIPISLEWDFTLAFEAAMKTLPETFQSETENLKCTPSDYRDNPGSKACIQLGVHKWIRFFSIFGTHVTTKVYLGGKLVTLMETNASQAESLARQGLDIQAALSAQIKDSNVDAAASGIYKSFNGDSSVAFDSKTSTFALGGNIYGNGHGLPFNEWAASVAKQSMPIRAEHTPISVFMDQPYKDAYKEAYLYYGKVLVGDAEQEGKTKKVGE